MMPVNIGDYSYRFKLALFGLNIDILLANLIKPDK